MIETPVTQAILLRRSIRRYGPEQIRDEELQTIIEAGRHAPSGGNSQTCHFIAIQNREVLDELTGMVHDAFAGMAAEPEMYRGMIRVIELCKKGDYDFIYHAPTLVVVANKRGYTNAMADSALAIENMMLAAASLGVGSCWINHLKWLTDDERILRYMQGLGLSADEQICGATVLGYADQVYAAPLKQTGNSVTIIR